MSPAVDTNAKALQFNLDPLPYGSFAEIGGGQEVSRWFFRVGGAAGTVAKTISAYDMSVSDSIYGAGERYVSRERLKSMLAHEFATLQERLGSTRGEKTAFFAFADTVATRNFKGTNECHGWIGLRMQHRPGATPSDILVHVSLHDPTAVQQQQSIGTLGVNLIFAAYYQRDSRAEMLRSLMDGLTANNLEVDVIECTGDAFGECLKTTPVALDMLSQGLTRAVVFAEDGHMEQPSTVFRKRGLLVHRCSPTQTAPVLNAMLKAATSLLAEEYPAAERPGLPLLELSIPNAPGESKDASPGTVERLDKLLTSGYAVLATSFSETFRISTYLRFYSSEPIRFLMGLDEVVQILRDRFYAGVDGGMLEGLGRLLAPATRLYVFSMPAKVFEDRMKMLEVEQSFCRVPQKAIVSVEDLQLASPAGHLLNFMRDAGWVQGANLPSPEQHVP